MHALNPRRKNNAETVTIVFSFRDLFAVRRPIDRSVVLAAVAKDGMALQFAGPITKDCHDVVMAAVKQNPEALQYAGPSVRGRSEVLEAAAQRSQVLAEHEQAAASLIHTSVQVSTQAALPAPSVETIIMETNDLYLRRTRVTLRRAAQ